jgi:hypothetical protein
MAPELQWKGIYISITDPTVLIYSGHSIQGEVVCIAGVVEGKAVGETL